MTEQSLQNIILLAGEAEAAALGEILKAHNSALSVFPAPDRASLDRACADAGPRRRLISFCSSVIVPKEHLESMDCGAYNFHPGPPSYPGRYPSVFALYEGARNFGVTFHAMAERVDEGPIIAAEWFVIPENCDLEMLDTLSFKALVDLFKRLARRLSSDPTLLKPKLIRWSGTKRAKADCDALCTIGPDASQDEIALKTRVCGVHLNRQE